MGHYGVVIIVALILFSVYRRTRRSIGYQPLIRRRMLFRSILFIVVGLVLIFFSVQYPLALLADAIGIVVGLALAFYAKATTKYEQRGSTWYYRPHPWISGIVIVLFIGRLAFDYITRYSSSQSTGGQAHLQASSYIGDPWTAGFILILFAYYPAYYLALVLWERRQQQVDSELGS